MKPKAKYRGKLLFCMMGSGKSYLSARSQDIIDVDNIYCEVLLTTPAGLLDMMRALTPSQHGSLHREALKRTNEELNNGKTVLTGSVMLGKYCSAAFGFDDPVTLMDRATARDRANRGAIGQDRARQVIDKFFGICGKHEIPVTNIGNNFLSKYLLT